MSISIFLIAGEESGDMLGEALMKDLKEIATDSIVFSGIGGRRMEAQGLCSLFPMTDLSVMGLAEVLKHLPRLMRRHHQTVQAILAQKPDIVVTIDAPDFSFRVAKKIKRASPAIRIVHMVAPTVWAWRPGRAKKIARFLDGLMCLFPFEPDFFTRYGLKTRFIGHPLEKAIALPSEEDKEVFYCKFALDKARPILCLLPGSRHAEIDFLLPIFKNVVRRLKESRPDLQIILPTLPDKHEKVLGLLSGTNDIIVFAPESAKEKYVAFAVSTAALHSSGTVALELALCDTPMITTYKVSALTAWVMRRLIRAPYANLVNILLNHPVVPEFIQEEATVDNLAAAAYALLSHRDSRQIQLDQFARLHVQLAEPMEKASAEFVNSLLCKK